MYTAFQRYEAIPNRRNPVSASMLRYMLDTRGSDPDALSYALTDFQIIGHYAGLRLSEYAQYSAKGITMTADGSSPRGFLISDFIFYGQNRAHIPQPSDRHLTPDLVFSSAIRFREQKNGDNGQIVPFAANTVDTDMCPVRAMLRIRARAQRLGVSSGAPIAVAKSSHKVVNLHEKQINSHIRRAAREVYGITDRHELVRFTTHSTRVGAAVHLHLAGKDGPFIKTRLRCRSDPFLLYLRNVLELAVQHATALAGTVFT